MTAEEEIEEFKKKNKEYLATRYETDKHIRVIRPESKRSN